jgi:hypothetical protein
MCIALGGGHAYGAWLCKISSIDRKLRAQLTGRDVLLVGNSIIELFYFEVPVTTFVPWLSCQGPSAQEGEPYGVPDRSFRAAVAGRGRYAEILLDALLVICERPLPALTFLTRPVLFD